MDAAPRRTSAEQKRQYWRRHTQQYQASGLSQAAYCSKHGLSLSAFLYWLHKHRSAGIPVKLVQVQPLASPEPATALRLVVNGYGIEVCEGFSPASLAAVVRVLREL